MRTSASGPVLHAVHASLPVAASSAVSQPRTPNSPPLLPTSTLPFTTSGAIVMLSPRLSSPSFARHTSLPLFASTAMVWLSSVLKKMRPWLYAAPRLTVSQQATPWTLGSGLGSKRHLSGAPGLVRSSANRGFGYGPTMYIVLSTTSGAASCPRDKPVGKLNASFSCAALPALTWSRVEKRVLAWSWAAMVHCPSSAGCDQATDATST